MKQTFPADFWRQYFVTHKVTLKLSMEAFAVVGTQVLPSISGPSVSPEVAGGQLLDFSWNCWEQAGY